MEFQLIRHGVIDSTSERAFESLADGSAIHGDVHLARGQTAGRGRRGRSWHSAPDEGIYMSVVLLPGPPALKPTALTIAVGLAVVEALNELGLAPYSDRAPRLKWPNDVLVQGAKICGILTESRALDLDQPHYVVGLGLNLRQLHFPAELRAERPVTSLALLGIEAEADQVCDVILARLGSRLEQVRRDHRRLAEDYLDASDLRDHWVKVESGQETQFGRVCGLSLSEGLELEVPSGEPTTLPLEFIRSLEPLSEPGSGSQDSLG